MGKLYIRYELDVSDEVIVEVKDVNCLLNDEKELYIQKDHLTAKLDICRCVSDAPLWQFRHHNWPTVMATQLSDLDQWSNTTIKINFSLWDIKLA